MRSSALHSSWCSFRYMMQMGPRERRARIAWVRHWVSKTDLYEACKAARRKLSS